MPTPTGNIDIDKDWQRTRRLMGRTYLMMRTKTRLTRLRMKRQRAQSREPQARTTS